MSARPAWPKAVVRRLAWLAILVMMAPTPVFMIVRDIEPLVYFAVYVLPAIVVGTLACLLPESDEGSG